MQGCGRDPAAFHDALRETARRYYRVAVVKYWNTCCYHCLDSNPVFSVDSKLSLAEVTFAHGLSLQGSIKMIKSLPDDNKDTDTVVHTLTRAVRYATDDTPAQVIQFSRTLSELYNNTCRLDNGSVIHILTTDTPPFRVGLQGMLLVRDADRRPRKQAKEQ